MKEVIMVVKSFLCLFLVVSLSLLVFPALPIQAQVCTGGGATAPIRPSGAPLFTISTDNSNFQLPSTVVCGTRAAVTTPSDFLSMKSLYYDQARSLAGSFDKVSEYIGDRDQSGISLTSAPDKLYSVTGDVTINSNVPGGQNGVIFVGRDLNIKGNIVNTNPTGIVFVVQRNINVDPSVTQIDAFMITFGQFCSGFNFTSSSCPNSVATNNQLTVNGSVVALSPDSTKRPMFVRSLNNGNITPAEKIIYQAKYLALFKDIFARTRTIWSELGNNAR